MVQIHVLQTLPALHYISLEHMYTFFFSSTYLLLCPDVFLFPFVFFFPPQPLTTSNLPVSPHTLSPALWRDVISNISCNYTHVMTDTTDRLRCCSIRIKETDSQQFCEKEISRTEPMSTSQPPFCSLTLCDVNVTSWMRTHLSEVWEPVLMLEGLRGTCTVAEHHACVDGDGSGYRRDASMKA